MSLTLQSATLGRTSIGAPPLPVDWLVGGGELGELIRAKDWSHTSLGPIEDWPQSLRSAVSILLPSKAQIVLFWGPQLVTLYNDAYREVFGAKHPTVLGLPARECWKEVWDVLQPLFQGVIDTGEAFWAKDHPFELHRNGYSEETYFDISYDPVRDETGRVGGLFCIVSETTRRVIGERRLAILRDLGRIGDGAESTAAVFRNAASIFREYAKDIPFAAFYRWDAAKGAASLLNTDVPEDHDNCTDLGQLTRDSWTALEPLLGSIARNNELVLTRLPDGVPTQLNAPTTQVAVLRIATPGKPPYGYLVAGINPRRQFDSDYRDFLLLLSARIANAVAGVQALEDERRRATALAQLDSAKTTFFSNVSHEFRTPLTLMLGPLDDLIAKSAAGEQQQTLMTVQRNGQRLLKLVNTMLDFARIEAGRTRVEYRPTDLATLTGELASNFRSACELAGVALEVDCKPLDETAYVDREMWEKIVLNLLSNAFKFTLAGRIAVRLRDAGNKFELLVSDTGTGIPAAALPRVFERFYRVDGQRGRSYEGSGIGLALVSELVKLHGGSINVRSTEGQGSDFIVTIPKGNSHLPAESVSAPEAGLASPAGTRTDAYVAEALSWLPDASLPAPLALPRGTPRILLADDNTDLREYARRLLAEHYIVDAVVDGQAALEAIRLHKPDLVISDVMMPRMDGFELLQQLRAQPELRTIPIILLSARAGEEARVEGLGRGADDYIVKPFSSRELLVRVGALLKSAEMHRRAREALSQFEALLNNAPVGVYLVDDQFRIAAVNPVATPVFGAIPDLVGQDFSSVMHVLWPQSYANEIVRLFRHTLLTGEPHIVSEHIEKRQDREVLEYYEWQINRIPLPGDRHGVVCYFRDISKTVLAREALREADIRKDQFLATLSHELRNPLAPLRSSVELLKLTNAKNPRTLPALDIIERQVNHMVRLVDDLMEVSRITRGSVELRKEPLRLDVALRNALETSEPLVRAGRHRLNLSLPSEPIVILADAVRLAQVFGNLINNAAKYSENGGTITIEAWRDANHAVIAIKDTGDGIEASQLPQLFKIFSRGRGSAKRHQSGLGIGLALVRYLVEMHEGSVEATSAGAGKGSTFTVRLPIHVLSDAPPADTETDSRSGGSAVKILVVDDNCDAAESLSALLHELGAEVKLAHNGPDALTAHESYRPRVILLDIGMPTMDGYEVARRLRSTTDAPSAPVLVAVTGWAQDVDRERAREAGFDHHLVKPVGLSALRSLLASVSADGTMASANA